MNKLTNLAAAAFLLCCSAASAQDVASFGLKFVQVLAEDDKARVLKYTPHAGDKTPMHSHPATVVYVIKGGRVKSVFPDGSTKITEVKTGQSLIRPPVTHADEALDDVELVLVELKK
jgi:mannose-6-phosphate isomerase-like protein (cupin superfamily)